MIPETFSELRIEFSTVLDEVNQSEDPTFRNALIAHARSVLDEAITRWQEELAVLHGMLESLSKADSERIKLATTKRRNANSKVRTRAGKSSGRRVSQM